MKKGRFPRTSDLARAADVHPNAVRLYEAWGFLPPVSRGPNGYRRFTEAHLDEMLLPGAALKGGGVVSGKGCGPGGGC